ncbi:MAG: hypothetical protein Q9169_001963 [Polycauliona sp. 2 TL-2023]
MPPSQASTMGFSNAAAISAFLSRISPPVQPPSSSSNSKGAAERVVEQNPGTQQDRHAIVSGSNGAIKSIPHPEPTATLPNEEGQDRIPVNAPSEYSTSKNPVVAAVQAQGSPQVSGVQAPPPTPETSNQAIGRLLMDVLEEIPQDRVLSLGDSIHAPKSYSQLRWNHANAASQSASQFFSPVPRSSKLREDANFTRMSFKAAENQSPPLFNPPSPQSKLVTDFQALLQSQVSVPVLKENAGPLASNDTDGIPEVKVNEPGVMTVATTFPAFDTPNTPPPPPRLEPSAASEIQAAKVSTPDVPDRPLEAIAERIASLQTPIEPRYSRVNPIPIDNVPRPTQEDEKTKENHESRQFAAPKSLTSVRADAPKVGTPGRPLTPVGGLLTPASMTFGAISSQSVKAAGIKTASGKSAGENLEDAIVFKAWPKSEGRGSRTAAKVRKMMLTGIPSGATPSMVASLVFGGPLERIHVGDSSAFVTFLRGDDAEKYYEATENGLEYEKNGVKRVIMTEMTSEVNPVSGVLREYIEKEFTRCVRAIGVDREWTAVALHEVAARKGRKVEKIVDGLNASKASAIEPHSTSQMEQSLMLPG